MATPEGATKEQIIAWLKAKRIFHWVNQAGRIPGRKLIKTGVADILGCHNGKMLAIEVKSPTGSVSDEQMEFIFEVRNAGGIAFVARSVDEVIERLRLEGIA